jgi:hypothetical protein
VRAALLVDLPTAEPGESQAGRRTGVLRWPPRIAMLRCDGDDDELDEDFEDDEDVEKPREDDFEDDEEEEDEEDEPETWQVVSLGHIL